MICWLCFKIGTVDLYRGGYWHNAMDPEQNYGILAVESKESEFNSVDFLTDTEVEEIETGQNESYTESYDNYEELIMLINDDNTSKDSIFTAGKFVNLSKLLIGSLKDNLSHIEVDGNRMKIRLPYGLLGIADPTSNGVLYDEKVFVPTERYQINTTISNELDIKIMMDEGEIPFN